MLPPVTKRYDDNSTDRWFHFTFYCDRCQAKWESEQYPFSMPESPRDNEGAKRAQALLWKAEHDAAYDRANTEALFHFSKCPSCGRRVCDRCYSGQEDHCVGCSCIPKMP